MPASLTSCAQMRLTSASGLFPTRSVPAPIIRAGAE
jgi:hypothetical protein